MAISFLIRLDTICPKWIESIQNGSNLLKMDQICPKWFKSVQNGSNLIELDISSISKENLGVWG
jgi:hypothetical protein